MNTLPERIAATAPLISARTRGAYFDELRQALYRAAGDGRLKDGVRAVSRSVKMTERENASKVFEIVGGRLNRTRAEDLADLRTSDGGWITFFAVLKWNGETLEILAYNFERFFGSEAQPRFVRFDYDPPDRDDHPPSLRSHIHPGNDDLRFPSPVFAPHELIDLLLREPEPGNNRAARAKGR